MPRKDQEANRAYWREYRRTHREQCAEHSKRWAQKHPESVRARQARYRARHPDEVKARKRAQYHAVEKPKQRVRALKRKFGITPEMYDALLAAQGGVCAICRRPEMGLHTRSPNPQFHGPQRLCVDHDHETQVIRGLLCRGCNAGVALLRDDPETLANAIAYLRAQEAHGPE